MQREDPEAEHYGSVKKLIVWMKGLIIVAYFSQRRLASQTPRVLIGEGETSLEDDSEQEPSFKCSESLC